MPSFFQPFILSETTSIFNPDKNVLFCLEFCIFASDIKGCTDMKKTSLLVLPLALTLAGCNGDEKKADELYRRAEASFAGGNYSQAKLQIDSIRSLYPKAFGARKAGIKLMQQVDLAEQRKTLAYLDSMMAVKKAALDSIVGNFVLEKDTAYQRIGHYLAPAQVIERNLHRSYLRFQTDETGLMSMTSIYCGSYNIHHTSVKVIAPDGNFAETPASRDSYETTDLGERIEKADYKLGEDGGVIGFIAANKDKNLRVNYRGDRTFTTNMMPADRKAAADVYALARLLSSITQVKKEREEARLKIQFVKKKIAERTQTVGK